MAGRAGQSGVKRVHGELHLTTSTTLDKGREITEAEDTVLSRRVRGRATLAAGAIQRVREEIPVTQGVHNPGDYLDESLVSDLSDNDDPSGASQLPGLQAAAAPAVTGTPLPQHPTNPITHQGIECAVMMQGNMLPFPADLQHWCQDAANSNPAGVLAFCCQWAQTLNHFSHRNVGCCHPFDSRLNSPASIDAACDLLEEVIKLRPRLVQGSENICRLGLVFNRTAAKVQKEQRNQEVMSGPVSVRSALDMTDSDNEL